LSNGTLFTKHLVQ